jgi:hypothetical protein
MTTSPEIALIGFLDGNRVSIHANEHLVADVETCERKLILVKAQVGIVVASVPVF